MDDELLRTLYFRWTRDPILGRPPRRGKYPDSVILLVYFFAVLRDRSPCWALDRSNWPLWARRLRLPSGSQFYRRLASPAVAAAIRDLNQATRDALPAAASKVVDARPLVVGGFSHDPDVRRGYVPGGMARGYKLHVVVDSLGRIDAFDVTPLNRSEAAVAAGLVAGRSDLHGCVVRGDANYDAGFLYEAVARAGGRFIAPRRRPGTGLGHGVCHPDRLRAINELEASAQTRRDNARERGRVEQVLAHLCNLPFGLAGLPAHVRRLRRVTRWTAAKIALYHLHLLRCQNNTKAA
jgi:hypothetical protein